MESLLDKIRENIEERVFQFINKVSEEYSINKEDLKKIWREDKKVKNKTKKEEEEPVKISKKKEEEEPVKISKKKEKEEPVKISKKKEEEEPVKKKEGRCEYKYTRKPREGEICDVKTKDGSKYCSAHKKYEDVPQKEKNVIPKDSPKTTPKTSPKILPKDKTLRKNPDIDNQYWHPDTKLVFKIDDDQKTVIGKCLNKKVIELEKEDIQICVNYNFTIDPEVLEKLKKNQDILSQLTLSEDKYKGKVPISFVSKITGKELTQENKEIEVEFNIKENKKLQVEFKDEKGKNNRVNISINLDNDEDVLTKIYNNLKKKVKIVKKEDDINESKSVKKDSKINKSKDANLPKKSSKDIIADLKNQDIEKVIQAVQIEDDEFEEE